MHLAPLIKDLAIILAAAGLVSIFFYKIRQPIVLGYLIAGMIVGPYTPPFSWVTDIAGIQTWAELGVIFLMLSLGIEFSFKKLKKVGRSALFTALFEVLFMLALGFLAGRLMNSTMTDSLLLGALLSISSTTIIVKAFEELKVKGEYFAKLTVGILIVEDLLAILILIGLSIFSLESGLSAKMVVGSVLKLVLVMGGLLFTGYLAIPRFFNYIGRIANEETLAILSLGFCLGLVVFVSLFQYSPALGAFIAGSILAESHAAHRIEPLIKPLRDIFAAIFFVSIGMLFNPAEILPNWASILGLTFLTILGKILSSMIGALLSGESKKTSFQVGLSMAQIGEFSFIIVTLGVSLGVMKASLYSIVVAVSVITTFTTPFLIRLGLDPTPESGSKVCIKKP